MSHRISSNGEDNSLRTFERDRIELTSGCDHVQQFDFITIHMRFIVGDNDNNNHFIYMLFEQSSQIFLNSYHKT